MKIQGIFCALIGLLLLCTGSLRIFADTRNVYIGDILTLQVSSERLSIEELREKFQAFEIVEIKDGDDGYLISVRTFETGAHKILLGDKDIVINIQSALEDIQREDIFEGDTGVTKPGFLFHWRVLFYVVTGVFFLSGGFVLIKTFLNRKIKAPTHLQVFLRRSGSLLAEDEDYFVALTLYFKEYLESLYPFRMIGKTSAEIMNELKEITILAGALPEIQAWLKECDRLKFTGVKPSPETKRAHYNELVEIVKKIDLQNEEAA